MRYEEIDRENEMLNKCMKFSGIYLSLLRKVLNLEYMHF